MPLPLNTQTADIGAKVVDILRWRRRAEMRAQRGEMRALPLTLFPGYHDRDVRDTFRGLERLRRACMNLVRELDALGMIVWYLVCSPIHR